MDAFLGTVLVVSGITQIVLFFKLWVMTNNVSEINSKLVSQNKLNFIREAEIMFYKGDMDKAKDILDTAFYRELLEIDEYEYYYKEKYQKLEQTYRPVYETMGFVSPDFEKFRDRENV